MKKLCLLIISAFSLLSAEAQTVTSLGQDFNVTCASGGTVYPLYWSEWNVIPPTAALAWQCTQLGGRAGTPGMQCNSFFSGIHYLDTAWLFTPRLDLTGFTDSVYLRFDSRYNISGARMQVLINHMYNTGNPPDTTTWTDMDSASRLSPVIGPDDSAGWVTHYVNLTSYKNSPLYVAFRYASTATTGGSWTIDNVFLTPWGLSVGDEVKKNIALTILGTSTTDKITFSCTFTTPGDYDVDIYDNLGRLVHKQTIYATAGTQSQTLRSLYLHSGMYFIKVGNSTSYEIAKTIVE